MPNTREKPRGRDIDRTVRQNDGAAHKKLAARGLDAPRSVQGKPARVDERPTIRDEQKKEKNGRDERNDKPKKQPTFFRRARNGTRSAGGSPSPNIADRTCTTVALAGGS